MDASGDSKAGPAGPAGAPGLTGPGGGGGAGGGPAGGTCGGGPAGGAGPGETGAPAQPPAALERPPLARAPAGWRGHQSYEPNSLDGTILKGVFFQYFAAAIGVTLVVLLLKGCDGRF